MCFLVNSTISLEWVGSRKQQTLHDDFFANLPSTNFCAIRRHSPSQMKNVFSLNFPAGRKFAEPFRSSNGLADERSKTLTFRYPLDTLERPRKFANLSIFVVERSAKIFPSFLVYSISPQGPVSKILIPFNKSLSARTTWFVVQTFCFNHPRSNPNGFLPFQVFAY